MPSGTEQGHVVVSHQHNSVGRDGVLAALPTGRLFGVSVAWTPYLYLPPMSSSVNWGAFGRASRPLRMPTTSCAWAEATWLRSLGMSWQLC